MLDTGCRILDAQWHNYPAYSTGHLAVEREFSIGSTIKNIVFSQETNFCKWYSYEIIQSHGLRFSISLLSSLPQPIFFTQYLSERASRTELLHQCGTEIPLSPVRQDSCDISVDVFRQFSRSPNIGA